MRRSAPATAPSGSVNVRASATVSAMPSRMNTPKDTALARASCGTTTVHGHALGQANHRRPHQPEEGEQRDEADSDEEHDQPPAHAERQRAGHLGDAP